MKIDLTPIYAGLKAWRHERHISVESQKAGYIVNVMEELGELAQALRDYEKYTKFLAGTTSPFGDGSHYDIKKAEHEIVDALCDISVFTINTGADLPCEIKPLSIEPKTVFSVADIFIAIADFVRSDNGNAPFNYFDFALILKYCASVCEKYGFNFELAMLETIKEISSRTGSYDKKAKKWVKDTSEQARAKWYKADYELARI